MLILLDINFTSYIPTSLLGLLGLISGYLFFYLRNKNNNKLNEIKSVDPKDRIRAIEMSLNELGVTFDTSNLNSSQKFKLIKRILNAKIKRYLIISVTLIIISSLISFLIWKDKNLHTNNKAKENTEIDTTKTVVVVEEVLKAPPDIDLPDNEYPSVHDSQLKDDIACSEEEEKTVILVKIEEFDENYDLDDNYTYILQDVKGVRETYYFDGSSCSNAERSWINTIMVIGRRLKINYIVCGSGGVHYLREFKPIRYYK